MDGNGRWAKARGHNRIYGHVRGAKVARAIIEASARLKIPHLTLYTFSSENWFRPDTEVKFLMRLLGRQLRRELATLMKNNIKFRVIGDLARLPVEVRTAVDQTIRETSRNTGMTLVFALSYGSRQEIVKAAQKLAERVQQGDLQLDEIDESLFASSLESSFLPDPDLIIRTSGESRLSNFLLWQSAYSEILSVPTLWPDFSEQNLFACLDYFASRERRFGRVLPDQSFAPLNHM